MEGRIWLRVVAGLVVVAAVAGVGFLGYQAGAARVATSSAAVPAPGQPGLYGVPYFWHPFGFMGFGCLGPLFALLLLFLALRALSFLFWGPRLAHWGHMRHGWRRGWDEEGGVPPMFREWHDRAHGAASTNQPDAH